MPLPLRELNETPARRGDGRQNRNKRPIKAVIRGSLLASSRQAHDHGAEYHIEERRRSMARATSPVVLVVDDDPDVLPIAAAIVAQLGYSVLEASNAAEALDVLQAHPEISLLFTDVVMPGDMDGFALAHEAKQLRPELRVVYTSGYMKTVPWGRHGIGYGPFVQKPWRSDQLAQIFTSLLSSRSSGQQPSC
jgi:CheY-like chemotaxis protein